MVMVMVLLLLLVRMTGLAPDGAAATCVQLTQDGGLSFQVKQGSAEGLQPFAGVTAVQVRGDCASS
jgi:hypothetical protein